MNTNRFSKDRPRFTDTLDVIKFLCKDLWMLVFQKQIDNLKTNHRVCVLPFTLPSILSYPLPYFFFPSFRSFLHGYVYVYVYGWLVDLCANQTNSTANKQGVYVLTDAQFKPLKRLSAVAGGGGVVRAQPVCSFHPSPFFRPPFTLSPIQTQQYDKRSTMKVPSKEVKG